ncbi:hypothetical protein ACO1O0_003797 [Amphichorda felina]
MASSFSPIELLPTELRVDIRSRLAFADVARLSRCSRALRNQLQPLLFNTEADRNRAIKWACRNGNTFVIDRAISFGASVSVLSIPRKDRGAPFQTQRRGRGPYVMVPAPQGPPIQTLTLYLAAKHGQVGVFRHLISLGATVVVDNVDPLTIRGLVNYVCQSVDTGLLRAFLEAGLASKLPQELRDKTLLLFLTGSASPGKSTRDLVCMLLDSGADPNYVHCTREPGSMTPLSATLVHHRPELFQLLLERGANINGVPNLPRHPLPYHPFHIPICAAAHSMARLKSLQVKQCLNHGADINVCVRVWDKGPVSVTTPLLIYLNAALDMGEWGRWIDTENIQFLLDSGLSLDMDTDSPEPHSAFVRGRYRFRRAPSPVELILDRLYIRCITLPPIPSVIKLLIQHGGLRQRTGEILAKYDYSSTDYDVSSDILPAWQDMLSMIIANPEYRQDLNTLLFTYITAKGTSKKSRVSDLTRATMSSLIAAGADINARERPDGSGPTVLHILAQHYSRNWYRDITPRSVEFVRYLVEQCHADTSADWAGTAADYMAREMPTSSGGKNVFIEEIVVALGGSTRNA